MAGLSDLGNSVMNLFRSADNVKDSGQLGAIQASTVQALPKDGEVTNRAPEGEPKEAADKTALAPFVDLFTMPTIDPATAPKPEVNPLDFDPNKLMEVAGKLDFTAGISKELIEKAKAGDFEAQMQVNNLMSQRAFAQGIHAMSGVAKKALEKQSRDLSASLPETVRASATAAALKEANPLYSHPAFAPVVSTLESQMRVKNPDATPAEITKHVNTYLDSVASMLKTGKAAAEPTSKKGPHGQEPMDWLPFFEGESVK